MENFNLNDEKVQSIIESNLSRKKAMSECLNSINLSDLKNSDLGREKMNYHNCMKNSGYNRVDFTSRNMNL